MAVVPGSVHTARLGARHETAAFPSCVKAHQRWVAVAMEGGGPHLLLYAATALAAVVIAKVKILVPLFFVVVP